jgi:cytochrome b561
MNWRNSNERYGSVSVSLHWFMMLLLIAVYAFMELKGFFPKGSDTREAMKTWHYMLGLSVFLLVCLRMAAHMAGPVPRIEPNPPQWQMVLAKLMHWTLYALMLCMPLAGWLLLSAEAKPVSFFGLHLPALVGESKDLADFLKEVHETGATVGYVIVGLHAAAALFHHYVVGDNTLLRLLPSRD